ncbi:hypothetical protein KEM56_000451 [Ascosphaera pollenicola]|nr:hypothetical protein KEM56_000451 [Ascosphaera pollenicola]
MRLLPHFPYPPPQPGYWDPITSTIDWCEENYYATHYAAEIVNTTTNLLFFFLGVRGCINCKQNGHDTIYFLAYLGYLLVGFGSFWFHATLKYPWQLVDELAMIYTTSMVLYGCFAFRKPLKYRIYLGTFLISLCVAMTLYYHYLQDPRFHECMYGVLTALLVFRSMYVMEHTLRPSLRAQASDHSHSQASDQKQRHDTRDMKILRSMWLMVGVGLTSFLGGFLLWNIDNHYCGTLRRWRHAVGLPWGLLLEGHGYWHIMTGTGAYMYIVWGIWLRHCLNGRQDEYEFIWPNIWTLPYIVRRKPEDTHEPLASGKPTNPTKKRVH